MKTKNLELRKLIREILEKEYNFPYLIEGVDIDNQHKVVSFNSSHEKNVNTSITINPIYSNIDNYPIISIFQRKDNSDRTDGNPLIYALKGIKGWKFKNTKEDVIGLLRQFIRIAEKIEPKYDTIITVPSTNSLNINFLQRLNKIIKANSKITDYFVKLSGEEVWEDFIDWSGIKRDFGDNYEDIYNELLVYFRRMQYENDDYFSYKFIPNVKLRKYITKTMTVNKLENIVTYAPMINGKNILILDDTVASGASVSECCNRILNAYTPNSITIITLFSKL